MQIEVQVQPTMASIPPFAQQVGEVYQVRTSAISPDFYAVLRLEDQVLMFPSLELAPLDDTRFIGIPFLHRPYAKLVI